VSAGEKAGVRTSFYDGFIQDLVVNKQQMPLYIVIARLREEGSRVLDVACGTGPSPFVFAKKCARAVGVDFSSKMIAFAGRKKEKRKAANADFVHADASRMAGPVAERFDYAVMSMFLHEAEDDARAVSGEQALSLAPRLIVADFVSPFPKNGRARFLTFQEFAAGKRHYGNFRDWVARGGIDGFVERAGPGVEKDILWKHRTGKIIMASKG
jgi:SAM-dependent methyltransferase